MDCHIVSRVAIHLLVDRQEIYAQHDLRIAHAAAITHYSFMIANDVR